MYCEFCRRCVELRLTCHRRVLTSPRLVISMHLTWLRLASKTSALNAPLIESRLIMQMFLHACICTLLCRAVCCCLSYSYMAICEVLCKDTHHILQGALWCNPSTKDFDVNTSLISITGNCMPTDHSPDQLKHLGLQLAGFGSGMYCQIMTICHESFLVG